MKNKSSYCLATTTTQTIPLLTIHTVKWVTPLWSNYIDNEPVKLVATYNNNNYSFEIVKATAYENQQMKKKYFYENCLALAPLTHNRLWQEFNCKKIFNCLQKILLPLLPQFELE